jgi:hypothetical protein
MSRPTSSVKPPKVLTPSRVLATLGICLCSTCRQRSRVATRSASP